MSKAFEVAFKIILEAEGGYSDDPDDTGGKTNYGIADARDGRLDGMADLDGDGIGDKPIAEVNSDDAKAIYRRDYWDACKCDQLPWPLSLYVFDAAVNQGVNPACRMLQLVLDCKQDGIIGQQTLTAASRRGGGETPSLYMAARAIRYTGTRSFDKFGKGWLKRIFNVARVGERCDGMV
jgi:lysozyme family protein